MVEEFEKYVEEWSLAPAGSRTLIAASAGVDSTVLCHLFQRAGLPFAIAHCNFQLRGNDSVGDEIFLKMLAQKMEAPFFTMRFETEVFASQNKMGIQAAARKLRYDWLAEILPAAKCQQTATAHHLDDNIETVLFNFAKGTGLRGMRGILPRRGDIVRPLLFATKKEVLEFAEQQKIQYREDCSNDTDKYSRNRIRHHVVPVLEQVAPGFQRNAEASIRHLADAEKLLSFLLEKIKAEVMETDGERTTIHLKKVVAYPAAETVLFELLRPFSFSETQVRNILQSFDNQPGGMFEGPSHSATVSSNNLVLIPSGKHIGVKRSIGKNDASTVVENGTLTFKSHAAPSPDFPTEPGTAWLDADLLTWPLTLRHWQPGDVFCPLGMEGRRKKLQDFFTDQKLSRFDKEEVWILESGGEICWVVGMRIDERFKVTNQTEKTIQLVFRPSSR